MGVLGMSDFEERNAFARLRGYLQEGKDDEGLCEAFSRPYEEIQILKHSFFEGEKELLRKRTTEETYAVYIIEQRRCMNDLERVIEDYTKQKNVQGYVGAIKAKSEILDKIIKTGQDFGLIERADEGRGLVAGQALIQMNHVEVKQYILGEIKAMNDLLLRYGDQDIKALEPGPLHLPLPTEQEKTKAHSRISVYGGRRVVHGKTEEGA